MSTTAVVEGAGIERLRVFVAMQALQTYVEGASIERLRVFVAMQALQTYIRTDGRMELTRGGTQAALRIVAEYTGKTYKRSMAGKREALADVRALLGED